MAISRRRASAPTRERPPTTAHGRYSAGPCSTPYHGEAEARRPLDRCIGTKFASMVGVRPGRCGRPWLAGPERPRADYTASARAPMGDGPHWGSIEGWRSARSLALEWASVTGVISLATYLDAPLPYVAAVVL